MAKFEPTVPFCSAMRRRRYPQSRITWVIPNGSESQPPYGLVIYLHGGDQETPVDATWKYEFGPQGKLHRWAEACPYVIAAPSAPPAPDGKRWNHPGAKDYVLDVLEEACHRFPIDRNRVILAGFSMGGFGTYHLSSLLVDRFAGVLLGAGGWWETDFKNLRNLPVFILHGRRDTAPEFKGTLSESRHHDWTGFSFAEAAAKIMEREHLNYHFYIHNQGHYYGSGVREGLRQFTRWMLSLRRDPDPVEVYLSTPVGSCDPLQEDHHQSFWLEIVQALSGDIVYDRIRLHGPNAAKDEVEFQQQSWSLQRVRRSGCSAHGIRKNSGQYRVKTQNVAIFRIWLQQKKLPETLTVNWNGKTRKTAVVPCRKKLDAAILYYGYAEFRVDLFGGGGINISIYK